MRFALRPAVLFLVAFLVVALGIATAQEDNDVGLYDADNFYQYVKKAGPKGPMRFGKRRGPSGPLRFGKRSDFVPMEVA